MDIESKARLYDDHVRFRSELEDQTYQLFSISDDGRWYETLAQHCAPHEDNHKKLVAIIDGKPHEVSIVHAGSQQIWFEGGDDCEMEYSFNLVANNIVVGQCSYREY